MEKKSSSIKVVEMGCSVCGKKVLFVEDTTKDAVLMCPSCAAKDPGGRVIIIGKLNETIGGASWQIFVTLLL